MDTHDRHASFDGRLVMLGFGSIGQAVLPLLLRHIDMRPGQIEILKPSKSGLDAAAEYGVPHTELKLSRDNYVAELERRLHPGDFLLNLSVDVSSVALMQWCREHEVLYLDAATEPWPGTYTDRSMPAAERTNYHMREQALALRRPGERQPTALITLGANPGLVSFLLKQALLDLAGPGTSAPADRQAWARLAQDLGVRVIHVAERDDQVSATRKQAGEFVNTWSVAGFVSEALQPAELGWGTHERHLPRDAGQHSQGCRAAIYLERPGAATQVRTWTPLAGPQHAFLVTHAESISIADHFTLGDPARPQYRPTVHYAYHPCDDAVLSLHELAGRQWRLQKDKRVMRDEITSGRDELGVLLMGHERGAYWYGSRLSTDEARALCPYNTATSLQVAAPIMAGVAWALKHPSQGILEADDLPFDEMLAMTRPYLGEVVGVFSDWTPLEHRESLFSEPIDPSDPWQFLNFRVG
ncbi:homospermidine synthase [Methylibium rhizosphaerae]|uniref:homospermidine synthase n=1 Tax=Methylibium rhizosphaerae TaxID=2570323 RepID=UPI00112D9354|nr:saccharopine dehydrogenase NADP-binding domain-containing protein [Methylibium rhizosphaerae]